MFKMADLDTDLATKLNGDMAQMVMSAINELSTENPQVAVHTVLSGILGAMSVVAAIYSKQGKGENGINRETVFFGALVLAHSVDDVDGHHLSLGLTPLSMYAAMQDFERITGKPAEDFLRPDMCAATRQAGTDPDAKAEIEKLRRKYDHRTLN